MPSENLFFEDFQSFLGDTERIEFLEYSIDDSQPLYLITWCPDEKKLPDADFYLQHNVNVKLLADYLSSCERGVWCVEATQKGVPHYHGWYQVSAERDKLRIAIMKTMLVFGLVDIKPMTRAYRPFSFTAKNNCLHYYKKGICDYLTSPQIIFCDTVSTVNFDVMDIVEFFGKRREGLTVRGHVMETKDARDFYEDTIKFII